MSIKVTCDSCGKKIDGDFVRVRTDFMTVEEKGIYDRPIEFHAPGDEFALCSNCYHMLLGGVVVDE